MHVEQYSTIVCCISSRCQLSHHAQQIRRLLQTHMMKNISLHDRSILFPSCSIGCFSLNLNWLTYWWSAVGALYPELCKSFSRTIIASLLLKTPSSKQHLELSSVFTLTTCRLFNWQRACRSWLTSRTQLGHELSWRGHEGAVYAVALLQSAGNPPFIKL